jgi:O-antigen ligase
VWPWASSPFNGPKWLVVVVAAGLSLALLPRDARRPSRVALAALANLGACLLSLALSGAPGPWWTLAGPALIACFSLSAVPLPWRAVRWAGSLAAAVVLLQSLRLDPFAWLGPEAEGSRLGRYGTLGNPDFVASVLGITAPLTAAAALRRVAGSRRVATASVAFQLLGLALLRSFATVLSLAAATLVALFAAPTGPRRRLVPVLGVGLVLAAVPFLGRSTASVLQGRRYLVTTAIPHVAEAPWLGQGPGAVVLHWPAWELERWRALCGTDAACAAAHPDFRFAGIQDHLHDDWLERLLESGVVGLAALVALFATTFVAAIRSRTLEGAGVAAALASLAARAAVDFPLARPADLVLLAVLCGEAARLAGPDSVDARRASPPDSAPEGGDP